jgi:long-chain fatty acid transport protein
VPDNDRLWLSLGAQWNAGSYGKFDLGYSYLYVKDPSITQAPLNGKYDASAHIVGLQYSVGF